MSWKQSLGAFGASLSRSQRLRRWCRPAAAGRQSAPSAPLATALRRLSTLFFIQWGGQRYIICNVQPPHGVQRCRRIQQRHFYLLALRRPVAAGCLPPARQGSLRHFPRPPHISGGVVVALSLTPVVTALGGLVRATATASRTLAPKSLAVVWPGGPPFFFCMAQARLRCPAGRAYLTARPASRSPRFGG